MPKGGTTWIHPCWPSLNMVCDRKGIAVHSRAVRVFGEQPYKGVISTPQCCCAFALPRSMGGPPQFTTLDPA